MNDTKRIDEIEKALRRLGMEQCHYCFAWHATELFQPKKIKYIEGAWQTERRCPFCIKN